jgi:hypothetical protein
MKVLIMMAPRYGQSDIAAISLPEGPGLTGAQWPPSAFQGNKNRLRHKRA